MERAFSQVPNGHNANALGKVYQHPLYTGERINQDIVGVIVAAPGDSRPFDRVALVVIPSMIVEVAPYGAVQVWRYSDISSLTSPAAARS